MAKEYRYGFVIVGDSEKGTKAIKRVREEVSQLEKESGRATSGTKRWRDETDRQTAALDTHNKALLSTKNLIVGIAGTAGIALLARGFKDTVVETERLKGSLVTVTGSATAANAQFDRLTKFAKETPFTLDQSVTAFIRLKALGLDPSERALKAYGNTAAAMGKDMMQMIEAVADASTMEFERLKEFGIKAKQEGDNVTFTFQGVSTTVRKNAAEIEEYLTRIGEVQFGSAMADQMTRLPGLLSNLEDSVDGLFRKLGDTGGITLFGDAIRLAIVGVEGLTENTDLLYASAEVLTVLFVSRVAPAVLAVVAAKRVAIAESIAYQAALARMAGVSSTAAAGQLALAGAIGGVNTALALLGGPAGAAILAAYGLFKLAEHIHKAATETETYTEILKRNNEQLLKSADAMTAAYLAGMGGMSAPQSVAQQMTTMVEGFVGPMQQMTTMVEGFVGPMQQVTATQSSATTETQKYIAQLQRQVEAAGMSERAAAIYNAVTKEGIELTGENAAAAATMAARLYDLQHGSEKLTDKAAEYIGSLREQYTAMQMTGRAAAIYNAVLKAGTDATAEQIVEAATLAAQIYDLGLAQDGAVAATKRHEKTSTIAAKAVADNWQRTHEALTDIYFDVADSGENAFDIIEKAGVRAAKRILAEFAALKTMEFLGIKTPFGAGASTGGTILNAAISGSGGMLAAGGGFLQGLFGTGQAAAGFMGPPTAAASAGMGAAALATNPATWAIAALAFAAKNDFWKDPDGYKRSFAGLLTAPTAGAAGSTFSVDPFASGFNAIGIAHNADQSTANQYINVFRQLDSSIVELVKELGGMVDLSKATLAGVGIDGRYGTAGTFLGMGGKTTDADIAAMVNLYASQLAGNMMGLDQELLRAVQSAGSAEEMIAILSDAIDDQKVVAGEAAKAVRAQIEAEEKLLAARFEAVNAMTQEIASIRQLQRTVEMDIYSAMGATPLFGSDTNGQLAALEYQRDLILSNHASQIKAEEDLHNKRMEFSQSLAAYATNLRLGQYSSLSSAGKLDVAQAQFRSLAELAQGGDLNALRQLQGAAEQYVTAADTMYASSSGRKNIVAEVLGVMDSLSSQLAASTFDPAAANQALVMHLESLDAQLAEIKYGINESIISELQKMNLTLSDLSPKMQDSLYDAIGQWIDTAMPDGQAMILALSGIKGSVDMLPAGIGGYMTSAIGSMLSVLGNMQRTVETFTPGSITKSAGEQALIDQGFNLNYSSQEIKDYIDSFGEIDNNDVLQIYADARANNVGSAQISDNTGYTQQQIYDALRAAGIDPAGFATGGISTGPMSGHLEWLHGSEAVVPLPDGRSIPVQLQSPAIDMKPLVDELQALRKEVAELRGIALNDADFSGNQRERLIGAVESVGQKLVKTGTGTAQYAKRR